MNTTKWGPYAWEFLHPITFIYPLHPTELDKKNYYNFFMSIKNVLPCIYCRRNYDRNVGEIPIRLDSRKDLVHWLIDLHNEVNGKEGRRSYTYEEVIKKYENLYDKKLPLTAVEEQKYGAAELCKTPHKYNLYIIFVAVILLAACVFYIKR